MAMRTVIALFVLMFLSAVPSLGQWTFVSQANDLASGHGALVITNGAQSSTRVSTNGGQTWDSVYNGYRVVVAVDSGFIVSNSTNNSHRSDVTGSNWKDLPSTPYNYTVNRYFFDSTTKVLYAATQRGYFLRSYDQGNSWEQHAGPGMQDLTFVHARGNVILAGYNGASGSVQLSTDGGTTWNGPYWRTDYPEGIRNANYATGARVADDGRLYVTTSGGPFGFAATALWRSSDNGATWKVIADSLDGAPWTPLLLSGTIYTEGSHILFTAGTKFWVSSDDGTTWSDRSDGILATGGGGVVAFHVYDGNAYALLQPNIAGSQNFGIYRRSLSELGFTGKPAGIHDDAYSMSGPTITVAPNPVHEISTISIALEQTASARITVLDVLGREVTVLYSGRLEVGDHRFQWNDDSPMGIYLVCAEINGKMVSRQIMRVR